MLKRLKVLGVGLRLVACCLLILLTLADLYSQEVHMLEVPLSIEVDDKLIETKHLLKIPFVPIGISLDDASISKGLNSYKDPVGVLFQTMQGIRNKDLEQINSIIEQSSTSFIQDPDLFFDTMSKTYFPSDGKCMIYGYSESIDEVVFWLGNPKKPGVWYCLTYKRIEEGGLKWRLFVTDSQFAVVQASLRGVKDLNLVKLNGADLSKTEFDLLKNLKPAAITATQLEQLGSGLSRQIKSAVELLSSTSDARRKIESFTNAKDALDSLLIGYRIDDFTVVVSKSGLNQVQVFLYRKVDGGWSLLESNHISYLDRYLKKAFGG